MVVFLNKKATSFGVVICRQNGKVNRIINPDFEKELDWHFVSQDEYMLRVDKSLFDVSLDHNSMTFEHVTRIVELFGK